MPEASTAASGEPPARLAMTGITKSFGGVAAHSYLYVLGNRSVTWAMNVLFDCYIRDMMTCFKLMPLELYRSLDISSRGFGMEAEITGKLLARRIRPFEVPITYRFRTTGRSFVRPLRYLRKVVPAVWREVNADPRPALVLDHVAGEALAGGRPRRVGADPARRGARQYLLRSRLKPPSPVPWPDPLRSAAAAGP